jgi:hypothetical protein
MNEPHTPFAPTRTLAQFEDTHDLESVIAAALAARPVDESMLRRGSGRMSAKSGMPERLLAAS